MADKESDLLKQFAAFLEEKSKAEKDEQQAEDFEIEFWNEKGEGVRTRRSHAKPFLQQFGIDVDEHDDSGDDNSSDDASGNKPKATRQSKAKSPGPQSTVRKYFVKG